DLGLVEEARRQPGRVAILGDLLDEAELLGAAELARRRQIDLAHPAARKWAQQRVLAEHPREALRAHTSTFQVHGEQPVIDPRALPASLTFARWRSLIAGRSKIVPRIGGHARPIGSRV